MSSPTSSLLDRSRDSKRQRRTLTGPRSLANSAGVLGWPAAYGAGKAQASTFSPDNFWVRVGGLLYGLSVVDGKSGADFGFAPAMTLSTKLIAINGINKGERIGYAATWECPEDMRVGVAAIGYGDGYPRSAAIGHAGAGSAASAHRSSAACRWT